MRFRKANQRDVDSLQAFASTVPDNKTIFGHSLGREFFKSIIRTGLVYVGESDKKELVGFLLADADARIQFSNIIHISVGENCSKDEVTCGLLDKHYEECKKMNISDIALHTPDIEKGHMNLLTNMGFNPGKKFVMLTKQVEGFNEF